MAQNIMFSQTREDPTVELFVIDKLNKNNLDLFTIASGGCTLFSMISDKIKNIDVVDISIEQLYLCQLKLSVLLYFKDPEQIVKFFQGELDKKEFDNLLEKMDVNDLCKKFWNDNKDSLYYGINRCGKFEHLFVELAKSNFNFNKCFARENLISLFGENAVQNSKNKEFFNHFKLILENYRKLYLPENNYFYHQVLYGKYNLMDLPPYFYTLDKIHNYKNTIRFIRNDCCAFIKKRKNCYDFMNLSNISDWMNENQVINFFQDAYDSLKDEGFIIVRRLNSDINLRKIVEQKFKIIEDIPFDKSCFYSEVIIGQK